MPNFDGEYELRIFYTTTVSAVALEHRMTMDLAVTGTPIPGTDFGDIVIARKDSGSYALDTWLTTIFFPELQPLYHTTTDFIRAELWYAEESTFDFTFIAVMSLGLNGTSSTAVVPAQQATMTYRSAQGGIGRIQLMEPSLAGDNIVSFPTPTGLVNDFMEIIVGDDTPILARDNSVPVAANRYGLGQNEKLVTKRYRP